ncbi:hypothetical protein [Winogradskya humida]|uniref:Pyrroloquinoline-quinone binding quinoprotein n=1 Tax=Winogradskya humida TaxID=113566 RepID=A0ABQ3ZJ21_9ACTN|nr:hypothetical protein [Actinoplanes humidus]GIE18579.1 hypothetical protein Ahu01nite_016810 [Actinoplanes humidus]
MRDTSDGARHEATDAGHGRWEPPWRWGRRNNDPEYAWLGAGRAVDAALRESGGGRVAGVRVAGGQGRPFYAVQFIRGDWLCTASVDALTGDVASIVHDGDAAPARMSPPVVTDRRRLTLPHRVIGDIQASVDDPSLAYVATDAGVSTVRMEHDGLRLVAERVTGFGSTRQIAAVPGGVAGITGDGRAFMLHDRPVTGLHAWVTRLPASPYTIASAAQRVLIASDAGAVELDLADGRVVRILDGTPVRAATYLRPGKAVLATHSGWLSVVNTVDGTPEWCYEQGEYPDRMWSAHDRILLAGEGGLKEVVPGEGVVCRWSTPLRDAVASAASVCGQVFTCTPGAPLAAHSYATAAHDGPLDTHPDVITTVRTPGGRSALLAAYRDGTIEALEL